MMTPDPSPCALSTLTTEGPAAAAAPVVARFSSAPAAAFPEATETCGAGGAPWKTTAAPLITTERTSNPANTKLTNLFISLSLFVEPRSSCFFRWHRLRLLTSDRGRANRYHPAAVGGITLCALPSRQPPLPHRRMTPKPTDHQRHGERRDRLACLRLGRHQIDHAQSQDSHDFH